MASAGHDLKDRWRKFAQRVVSGMPAGRAYEKSGFKARGDAADVSACKLLRTPKVAAYVAELRKKATERGEESAYLSLDEKRRYLAAVVRTPVGEIDQNDPLCQEYTLTTSESGANEKIKTPCKLKALELDAKLAGELKERVEVEDKTVREVPSAEQLAKSVQALAKWGISFAPREVRGAEVG